jgi:hypothetical protein
MRMKGRISMLLAMSAALLFTGCDTDYAGVMQKKVRAALGDDFGKYSFFSYPTDNFGVMTAYDPATGTSTGDDNFVCATWTCLGKTAPNDARRKLTVDGFADIGGSGGIISLTEKEQGEFGASLVLPEIYAMLNLSAEAKATKGVRTEMQLGRAYPRKLVRDKAATFIKDVPADRALKQAFIDGRLVLVVADVVLDSMDVTLKLDKDRHAKLNAELGGKLAGTVGKVIGQGAKLEIVAGKVTNAEYTFRVSKPVVLAVLTRRQPTAGVLRADGNKDWQDWVAF